MTKATVYTHLGSVERRNTLVLRTHRYWRFSKAASEEEGEPIDGVGGGERTI